MKVTKKTIICSIAALILCLGVGSVPVRAAENEKKKVRVGIYNERMEDGADMDQYRAGFDHEYLMKIAEYAGWDCEVVEGSLQECITGIQNGTIDVMGNTAKEEEREEVMEFADEPSMWVGQCLLVDADSKRYNYEDYEAFDGMKIGTLEGRASIQEKELEQYSKKHGFHYTLQQYSTDAELRRALNTHEIDAVYLSDFRNLEGYKRIAEFGNIPYYFALNKERKDLKDELDQALIKIHEDSHYYENDLYSKYFTAAIQDAFSIEEKAYLEKNNVVTVYMVDHFPLICEENGQEEHYQGVAVDILKKLSAKTGLQFEYKHMPDGVVPSEFLDKHPNALMAPLLMNNLIPCNKDIQNLAVAMPEKMMGITRVNGRPDFEQEFTIAMPEDMYGIEDNIKKVYPKAEVKFCKSHQDCLAKVARGEADLTLINEISGSYMLQSPYYQNLQPFHTDEFPEDISFGTSMQSDPLLVSSLNKAILSLSERDIREILVANTASVSYEMSATEWVYENALTLVLIGIIIIGSATFLRWRRRIMQADWEKEEKNRRMQERLEMKLRYQEEMVHRAKYDELTGIYNYQYFGRKAKEFIDRNPDATYGFFYINIEQFKMINEVYGRRYGDMVLKRIAALMKEQIGAVGVYARNYSDHFTVCYPVDEERLDLGKVRTLYYMECDTYQIRVQLGVGIYLDRKHEIDVGHCIEYAQIALQNGLRSGKGYVNCYRDEYMDRLKISQKITNEMDQALAEGQFQIYLQPQFDHIEGTLVGAEALVRWKHPVEGLISPKDFIPAFEKNGFIGKLDKYVCEEACKLLAKWKKQGIMIPISVNLVRSDLMDQETLPTLLGFLEKYEIPAELLHLEITESVYEESREELLGIVEQFKENGFILEMDDFGSGYSSLNMLRNITVDIIKMDMKFFEEETISDKGGVIVKAVVHLARDLGIPVIAEGVETEEDAQFLRRIGCRIVQGYLYGKPTEVEVFEELLKTKPIGKKDINKNTGAV